MNKPPLPCQPHIEIESSPGKYHRYFLTDTKNSPEALEEFASVQQRLVDDYGSDPNAKDVARVLRVAGFIHQKVNSKKGLVGTPFMVRLTHISDEEPYSWERIKELFPPVQKLADSSTHHVGPSEITGFLSLREKFTLLAALEKLDPDMDYSDWLKVGMGLHSTGGGDAALEIWRNWSRRGSKYREGDCDEKWRTFSLPGERQ